MRYLTAAETRDSGVLLEVNRRLLHPRGLAAELTVPTFDDDAPTYTLVLTRQGVDRLVELAEYVRNRHASDIEWPEQWFNDLAARLGETLDRPDAAVLRLQDHRDDPEGVIFGDLDADDTAKAVRFEGMLDDHGRAGHRLRGFGYLVQPLPLELTGQPS